MRNFFLVLEFLLLLLLLLVGARLWYFADALSGTDKDGVGKDS